MLETPEATNGSELPPLTPYGEAEELLYMFYYSGDLEYKKEVYESLRIHIQRELLKAHAPICEKCARWSLYHDCGDPDILPEDRLKKNPDNCSTFLSSNCKTIRI